MLTKTRTVWVLTHWLQADNGWISFRPLTDDPRDTVPVLEQHVISREVWEDLGRPFRITITVEPGDRLNDDA